MFAFTRRVREKALTAVIPTERGLAVAQVAQDNGSRPAIIHCEYVECPGEGCTAAFVRKKLKPLRIGDSCCTTTMILGEYTILSVEAPDVPLAELRAAVRWQIKDLIDFHIDDAVLDVFDAPASGADQRQHDLYVVVSRMTSVKQHINLLQEAELNLTTIDIPELVLRNIATCCPQDKAGIVFVYLNKDKGVITITRDGTLYLARGLDIGYQDLALSAEKSGELSLDEYNPEFDRVALEIQRSLDFYDRHFSQSTVGKIFVSPTLQPIPGLVDYLNRNTGIETSILDVNEIIDTPEPLDEFRQAHCLLAIGAAMREEKKTL